MKPGGCRTDLFALTARRRRVARQLDGAALRFGIGDDAAGARHLQRHDAIGVFAPRALLLAWLPDRLRSSIPRVAGGVALAGCQAAGGEKEQRKDGERAHWRPCNGWALGIS